MGLDSSSPIKRFFRWLATFVVNLLTGFSNYMLRKPILTSKDKNTQNTEAFSGRLVGKMKSSPVVDAALSKQQTTVSFLHGYLAFGEQYYESFCLGTSLAHFIDSGAGGTGDELYKIESVKVQARYLNSTCDMLGAQKSYFKLCCAPNSDAFGCPEEIALRNNQLNMHLVHFENLAQSPGVFRDVFEISQLSAHRKLSLNWLKASDAFVDDEDMAISLLAILNDGSWSQKIHYQVKITIDYLSAKTST